jgi:arylsulfatase A
MRRRQFLSTLAAAPAVLGQKRRPPNIVWLMADDMAYADAGCYGQTVIRTPFIDSLARDGMQFTDAYAGSTVCAPSRSVLLTGKHTGHTSIRSNPGGVFLLDSDVTIGEVLKPAGYTSGCFGKWGLGDIGTPGVPWKQGFDQFFGYLHQAHAHYFYPPYLYENDRQVDLPANKGLKKGTFSHDLIVDKSLEFIRKNRNRPFFMYGAYTLPHWEPQVPAESMAPYRGKFAEDRPFVDKAGRLNEQKETYAAYCGMISHLDREVGRVLSLLRKLDLAENTIVFFTSDNGGASRSWDTGNKLNNYGPFRGRKTTLYEGGLRVPMLARWPGRIEAGRRSTFPWMFMDALPTFAELADTAAPDGIDGFSVLPTLLGRTQKPHEYLYWENPVFNSPTMTYAEGTPPQAIRFADMKAVRPKTDGPIELYSLTHDPGEKEDLWESAQPAMRDRIEALFRRARTEPRSQSQPPHRWFDKPWW